MSTTPAFEKQEIRTWTAGATGAATPSVLRGRGASDPARASLETFKSVSNQQLVSALSSADQTRHLELRAGKTKAAALVTPEDGSTKVKAMHMAVLGADQTGLGYQLEVARIGKAEGFNVVLRVPAELEKELAETFKKEKLDNVTLVPIKNSEELDFWSEDQGELHADGSVSVPRSLTGSGTFDSEELLRAVTKGRMERLHPRTEVDLSTSAKLTQVREKYRDVSFSSVGAVGERGGQRAIAALAVGGKKPLRVSNGYLEGGNALVGRRKDGTGFAVLGADSVAVTQAALSKELGRPVSAEETRTLLAQDYGVDPTHLVVVEQPGDFHIDMHVSLLPNGKAVVNDPMAVFELQKQWLTDDLERSKPKPPPAGASKAALTRYAEAKDDYDFRKKLVPDELSRLEKAAKTEAAAIARTVKDLEQGGLEVHRLPGVFPPAQGLSRMNFMNAEQGLNAKGERFMLVLGGDPRAEKLVAGELARFSDDAVRVHFLDRTLTETTLNAMGGISCRVKIEGER